MLNEKWKMIRSLPLPVLKRLRHLPWVVRTIDKLFALGCGAANDDCLGSRRVHRRTGRAGEGFEGYLGAVVASQDVRKGSAQVISSQQLETVANLSVRRQGGRLRRYCSRLNSTTCAAP